VADGAGLGPLHGVPFTVKENIDLAGTPTTQAVPALAEAVAPVDAPQVERLRAAGAIPFGRTNLPDFGLRVHTDSALHGLTRNPWNPRRSAGGSSGGEAAALATGMTRSAWATTWAVHCATRRTAAASRRSSRPPERCQVRP